MLPDGLHIVKQKMHPISFFSISDQSVTFLSQSRKKMQKNAFYGLQTAFFVVEWYHKIKKDGESYYEYY